MMSLVAPLLGNVRSLLEVNKHRRSRAPIGRIEPWRDRGGADLLREVARATDDLGVVQRWRALRVARRIFGRDFEVALLGRWSPDSEVLATMILAGTDKKQPRLNRGLWAYARARNPPVRLLRVLEAKLTKLYKCGRLVPPPPRAVTPPVRLADTAVVLWLRFLRKWPPGVPEFDDWDED